MRQWLLKSYWALERLIAPRVEYSQIQYHRVLAGLLPKGCNWLDIGCGHQMFADFMLKEEQELAARASHIVGIDLDFHGMLKNRTIRDRVFGDASLLPFSPETFDFVTANMVAEHLPQPQHILAEVHRILRPGGKLVFHTPNRNSPAITAARMCPEGLKRQIVHVFEGRQDEDIFPTFYNINTPQDVAAQLDAANFSVDLIAPVSTSAITAPLGPAAIPELLFLRMLDLKALSQFRSNLIVVATRQARAPLTAGGTHSTNAHQH